MIDGFVNSTALMLTVLLGGCLYLLIVIVAWLVTILWNVINGKSPIEGVCPPRSKAKGRTIAFENNAP